MLRLEQINLCLSNGEQLFNCLSYTFAGGQRHIISGHNGVGKSTLLGVIAGLRNADDGALYWGQSVVHTVPFYERTKQFLGVVFQRPAQGCVLVLTVGQNLQLAGMKNKQFSFSIEHDAAILAQAHRYAEALNLNLADLLDRPMAHLSGGQQQLIACIMVLLTKPKLLLLDEPTAALSPSAVGLLTQVLIQYQEAEGSTIICVTHDTTFAQQLGTMMHELDSQRLRSIPLCS